MQMGLFLREPLRRDAERRPVRMPFVLEELREEVCEFLEVLGPVVNPAMSEPTSGVTREGLAPLLTDSSGGSSEEDPGAVTSAEAAVSPADRDGVAPSPTKVSGGVRSNVVGHIGSQVHAPPPKEIGSGIRSRQRHFRFSPPLANMHWGEPLPSFPLAVVLSKLILTVSLSPYTDLVSGQLKRVCGVVLWLQVRLGMLYSSLV